MSQNAKIIEQQKNVSAENAQPAETYKIETKSDVVKAEKQTERQLNAQKRVWLTINSTEKDSSNVTVAINGYAYRIKRDEPALVPESVIEVLKLASQMKGHTEQQGNGQVKMVYKNVRRFSFTVEPIDAHPLPKDKS